MCRSQSWHIVCSECIEIQVVLGATLKVLSAEEVQGNSRERSIQKRARLPSAKPELLQAKFDVLSRHLLACGMGTTDGACSPQSKPKLEK